MVRMRSHVTEQIPFWAAPSSCLSQPPRTCTPHPETAELPFKSLQGPQGTGWSRPFLPEDTPPGLKSCGQELPVLSPGKKGLAFKFMYIPSPGGYMSFSLKNAHPRGFQDGPAVPPPLPETYPPSCRPPSSWEPLFHVAWLGSGGEPPTHAPETLCGPSHQPPVRMDWGWTGWGWPVGPALGPWCLMSSAGALGYHLCGLNST